MKNVTKYFFSFATKLTIRHFQFVLVMFSVALGVKPMHENISNCERNKFRSEIVWLKFVFPGRLRVNWWCVWDVVAWEEEFENKLSETGEFKLMIAIEKIERNFWKSSHFNWKFFQVFQLTIRSISNAFQFNSWINYLNSFSNFVSTQLKLLIFHSRFLLVKFFCLRRVT